MKAKELIDQVVEAGYVSNRTNDLSKTKSIELLTKVLHSTLESLDDIEEEVYDNSAAVEMIKGVRNSLKRWATQAGIRA